MNHGIIDSQKSGLICAKVNVQYTVYWYTEINQYLFRI